MSVTPSREYMTGAPRLSQPYTRPGKCSRSRRFSAGAASRRAYRSTASPRASLPAAPVGGASGSPARAQAGAATARNGASGTRLAVLIPGACIAALNSAALPPLLARRRTLSCWSPREGRHRTPAHKRVDDTATGLAIVGAATVDDTVRKAAGISARRSLADNRGRKEKLDESELSKTYHE